ncbi:MAG: cellulose synthase catalytic subunit [Gammaproteobacteria bacterium]|nr:cellulose synthase catalytic subunit [Gammaproteobacteria bacterium]MBU1654484.1 cellulose synthase catalytic subunit [Gammaproteobacteria bacterium]MBU1960136.1 cellulose synthase catalytic subunit [Gammaproteobacteria bacterium]
MEKSEQPDFYFLPFEDRRPPEPVPYSMWRELLWQFLATLALGIGAWYIAWRWGWSLNYNALWFSIPLVMAETAAYIGLALFTINLWKTWDYPKQEPPAYYADCVREAGAAQRPIKIDVFFPSFDEDPELVRLSLRDAKRIRYPHPIDMKIHVLDDGKRESMKQLAEEEAVGYITRDNNIGFKAGNMRNAMEQTSGDFILICDADTRPFPSILEHTLGYFRDPDVAWVQTPQWFFDLPEGRRLPEYLSRYLGGLGRGLGKLIERCYGPVTIGEDPFVNSPTMFYDVIQRRRNWANASFCCGAGSIHRRDAVMEAALKGWANQIHRQMEKDLGKISAHTKEQAIDEKLSHLMLQQVAQETEFTPYKFHVSEDIYTSMMLHGDPEREWKSVMHPEIESKMLSPQDLLTWTIQRFKYAGGTLDICLRDNPLFRGGMSLPQKVLYGSTFWSYFGGLWNLIFLVSPMVYLFTGVAPVSAYSMDFFKHILPFMLATELAFMVGTWGVAGFKGKASYLSFFPVNLRAIWTVLKGEKIKFPTTPKDRQTGNFFNIVIPQVSVIVLTVISLTWAWANYYFMGNQGNYSMAGLVTNLFWGLNNIIAMSGLVFAAFWKPESEQ